MKKVCFRCHVEKPIEDFHKHARMKDGRLNKCAACTVEDVRQWRARQPGGVAGNRAKRYERELATGARTRKAPRGPIRGRDKAAAKARGLRYFHKRRAQCVCESELDAFAFTEALDLADRRAKTTGFSWHVDHRVPINHKQACGLHVAANFQVVPGTWNVAKGNRSMADYWPLESATC